MSSELPEKLEDSSSKYHARALVHAQKRLKYIQKLSLSRAGQAARTEFARETAYHHQAIQETAENCFKLSKVLAKAAAYQPPSPDHENFKEFMITQLSETIDHDGNPKYHTNALAELKLLTPEQWKAKEIISAGQQIAYHTKALAESVVRNNGKNQWLEQLKMSLA